MVQQLRTAITAFWDRKKAQGTELGKASSAIRACALGDPTLTRGGAHVHPYPRLPGLNTP